MPQRLTDYERGIAALEWAQAQPCGMCGAEPRLKGDHLGSNCRAERNRKDAALAKETGT